MFGAGPGMRISLLLSRTWLLSRPWPVSLLLALICVTASTLVALAVQAHFNVYTLANLFLLAVLVSALLTGISGGLMTAFCAFLAYNYFFIPPTFTLLIANPDDFFALFMFLLTALVTGGLAGKIREQYHLAELHSEWMQSLVALTGQLAAASSQSEIFAVISHELAARWAVAHHIVTISAEGNCDARSWPDALDSSELLCTEGWDAVRIETFVREGKAGPHQLSLLLRPLHGSAVLVVVDRATDFAEGSEARRLLDAILAQAMIAFERAALVQENESARAQTEKERLRASLLSSVSHDLRTPLASIIGSASTLRQFESTLEAQTKRELAETIEDEAVRLSRFIDHLLAVTRTEAGFVGEAEWFDLADILHPTVERARRYFDRHEIVLTMQTDLPLLRGFPSLVEQGVFNIIENAAKYSPPASQISVALRKDGAWLVVSVSDQGSGIAMVDQTRIFDKFVRLKPDERQMGAGLGLTITRNIAQLMQGAVSVESPLSEGRGSSFSLRFQVPPDAVGSVML